MSVSSYSLAYSLLWPYYHLRPSTHPHVVMPKRPMVHRFSDSTGDCCRLLFFGDLMGLTGDRVPAVSNYIRDLVSSADLVVGNCESPVVQQKIRKFAFHLRKFRMGSEYLETFFDNFGLAPERCLLSIANNHSADHGAWGFEESIRRLQSLGVSVTGVYDRKKPAVVVRQCAGLKLGFAAWTHWSNSPINFSNPAPMQSDEALSFSWQQTRDALGLDTLVAGPHWGWEFQHFPQQETYDSAGKLASNGFDVIVGHHPHVVQPIDWFPGDRGPNTPPTLCHFSLGNLFGRTLSWPHRLLHLLEVELATSGPLKGRCIAYRCHPIVQLGAGTRTKLVPLHDAPAHLQIRMQERLARLFAVPKSDFAT